MPPEGDGAGRTGEPDAAGAAGPGFTVAAAILADARGRVLTVRKRGTSMFMLPGGKVEPGEAPEATARREVLEELGMALRPDGLRFVGEFLTATANEPGHWLRSFVFAYADAVAGERVGAEIDRARWVSPDALGLLDAPLTHTLADALHAVAEAAASG